MNSTTADVNRFLAARLGGELLPRPMKTPALLDKEVLRARAAGPAGR